MDALIRPAIDGDFPALVEMGRAFNEEAGYADSIPFDAASFGRTLKVLAEVKLLLVADKGDGPIGMAGADVAPSICNHSVLMAREAFWYVMPGQRNGVGGRLLRALERCAKAYGAQFFDAIAEEGHRNVPLDRIYRGNQYALAEHTYRKAL